MPVPVPPLVRTHKHNIELNPAFACDLLKLFARTVPGQLVGSARKLIISIGQKIGSVIGRAKSR